MSRIQEQLDYLRQRYDNMTDEEFKEDLIKAGFEIIEDKSGLVVFDDSQVFAN